MLKLFTALALVLALTEQSPKGYNDLDDYGFKGNPKKIIYSAHPNPVETDGKWTADEAPRFTKTWLVNDYGQFISETVDMGGEERKTVYEYRDSLKFKARVTAPYTKTVIKYSYTQNTYTTMEYLLHGREEELQSVIETTLDQNMLTIKEVVKNYNDGKLTANYTTDYTARDNGYITGYIITDVLKKKTTTYLLTVLERDAKGNPLLVIKKEDGKPYWLTKYKYEY
ncbi:MAG: hypothetical protein U0V74_16840 [Chitinophagales bacterium]